MPDAVTGTNFYTSKIEYFKNELYYLGESDHQILYKYDFVNDSPITVDTLSLSTGATVVHALIKVNDKLVISKRLGSLQHEMFVLGNGGASSISEIVAKKLEVNPTLASDIISIDMESIKGNEQALIFDINAQLVSKLDVFNGQIDVSNLMASKYFGFIEEGNVLYRFQFVKI